MCEIVVQARRGGIVWWSLIIAQVVGGVASPTLLSPFTLTLTLSHQGRGDFVAARLSPVKGEGKPPRPGPSGFPPTRE